MKTFAGLLISILWSRHHARAIDEREHYPDLRTAIYELRRILDLSQDELAARLGITTIRLKQMERAGSPVEVRDIENLKRIAHDYALFKMRDYFDSQLLLLKAQPRRRGRHNA